MAHEEHTDKTPQELAERAWSLAKSIRTAILATWDGTRQHLRPMSAFVHADEHCIYFLTDVSSPKLDQLARHSEVTAAFADDSGNKYVTFTGAAYASDDRAKIRELWSPYLKAWWDSADDPSIRLITLRPTEAELWDSPNKLIATAIMLSAAVTGGKPALGDHAKLRV